jgi:Domain of unknown function (DUF5753)
LPPPATTPESMSQAELGRLAGCDDSVVSRVEGGLEDPPQGFPEACDQEFPGMGGFFTRFYNEEALDRLVAARLERQRIFDRDDPPHVSILLDELVLHRLIGTPQVVHDQLVHVADMSVRSHISVQVIAGSVGAHPGLACAFMIASCDGQPDIMYIDAVEGQTMERNALVRKFAIAFGMRWCATRSRTVTARCSSSVWPRGAGSWPN